MKISLVDVDGHNFPNLAASFVNVKGGKLCRKMSFREYYK